MDEEFVPWSVYGVGEPMVSAGRRSLISAFSDLVRCQAGFQPHELPDIFAAPIDEGENDACRRLVALDAALLTTQFVLGKIATFARSIGGGETVAIPPEHWEIDDPLPRFATGTYNADDWANAEAPASHRILVDGAEFDAWLANLEPPGPLTESQIEEILDPRLRAARSTAAKKPNKVRRTSATDYRAANAAMSESSSETGQSALLTMKEVLRLTRLGRSTIYRFISAGSFPEKIKFGRASRWLRTDVDKWIADQTARRDAPEDLTDRTWPL
jgi:excisionase family DNA binding protein